MSTPGDFDIGPLTWVKSEIDQALERSLTALRAYASNPGDSNQIRFSQTHFHQAHGALQIVGLDGVTRLSEELDGLLADIAKEGAPKPEAVAAAERAFAGISAYLDQLLVGEPNQPLKLFAVYREVAKARGRDGVDPVDLYFPDLTRRPPRREKPPVDVPAGESAQYYRDQRGRYQRGLLKWLKKDATGVEDMRAAVAAVEAAQSNPASRAFWWIALGFFDALFAKAVSDQAIVGRLANRVEQQLKRLMEGSATVAERLMREVLFAVARARPATEHVRNVQEVFQLAGTVPASFELKGDGAPQLPALRALRENVGNAKTTWNKVASGHQPSIANFRDLAAQMRDRAADLKQPLLESITAEVATLAAWMAETPGHLTDGIAMETATALLLVENAVENFANLGAEFAQQVNLMQRRLQAVKKGEAPHASQPVPVLDEMSRRAQERLLMTQVVSEIQASLRTIEQALDAFFRDAAKRGELASLDKPIRQVLGALTMLNEDRAAAALSQCAAEIQRFAQGDYVPAQVDFERVAGTLSGLGFYVDALQHGKADFEQFMRPIAAKKPEVVETAGGEPEAAGATVEAELEQAKKELNALYERWKREPQNAKLKDELRQKATALQKDAGLVVDAKLEGQAGDMLRILDAADAKPFDPKVSQVLTAIQPVAPAAPSPEAQKLIAASAETVDAELLAVYLEEAGEVLATIGENLGQAREAPQNIELLRTIRRGFHTLKGSGRMVGLTRLGEAAWAVEQVMNRWLEEERAATPDLFTLIAAAREFFGGAVETLKANGPSPDESTIVAMANRVKAGEPLGEMPVAAAAPAPAPAAPAVVAAAPQPAAALPEIDLAAARPAPAPETLTPAPAAPVEIAPEMVPTAAPAEALPTLEFPALEIPAPELPGVPAAAVPSEDDEEVVSVGDARLSTSLYGIFLDETRTHLDTLAAGRHRLEEGENVSEDIERAAHTLAGIAGTVKFDAMKDLGHSLEGLLERLLGKPADPAGRALIGEAIASLEGMLARAAARELPAAVPALIARLDALGTGDEGTPAAAATLTASAELAELDFALPDSVPEVTTEAPAAAPALADFDFTAPAQAPANDAPAAAPALGDFDFTAPAQAPANDAPAAPVTLDFSDFSLPTPMGEPAVTAFVPPTPAANDIALPATPVEPVVPPAVAAAPASVAAAPSAPAEAPPEAAAEASAPAVEVEEIPVERRTRRLDDDIDQELLPIFLEEAQELVPAVGQGLRDWRENPANSAAGHALQRTLHTLKGSARMCGAMALGELTHHMETRVENALALKELPASFFEELEGSYDRMGFLYDRLVNPQAAVPAAMEPAEQSVEVEAPQAPAQPPAPEAAAAQPAAVQPAAVQPAAPTPEKPEQKPATQAEQELAAASRAMLRVRADLIDRLVNEAGEVSIARSRIEGDLRAIKSALFEFTENVNRMRAQLRDIEIQAESQMQSRISLAQESETPFDPLEFDRFTRFQELTRMMAESVNDVATVHQNLLKAVGESEAATSAQARLTRALQANLMRIRMVPFASVSERLFRIVRQAAKETEKRAVLDIKGGQTEVDRSVLERITAPFEHMLRNSVAHGIETPAARVAKGKPELGEVRIEVRQEGNEIVLAVVDDGAGLNFERIRAKALSQGLLKPEDNPTDGEIAEFIFHPGFSTAQEVTQLAGRGVGMDVVKSEIAALGGRIELASEAGKGTRFTIYLPLTLAVTQAVLVRAGSVAYAIPAVMVEQVRQVKAPELESYRAAGETTWQDRRYPFRYLPRLLGDTEFVPEPRRVTPVMLLRTGSSTVALQVDEVAGSQEIVVKNTGPLLARVAGITGATVLGNGDIVLILNPVILASREPVVSTRLPDAPVHAAPQPEAPAVPTIMIVDDSLTVRKITGRLLAREGYNVLTAKDGVDAVEQLQERVPDVMLVDIEMPRMDGFDLTRNVRADRRLKHIPIIMITSRTADKHRAYAKEIGVNVYLGKPYQEDELLQHIGGFVKKPALA